MSMMRFVTIGVAVYAGVALAAGSHRAQSLPQPEPQMKSERWAALGIEPHELVLDNGFRIVLVEDHRVPRVAASLWYRFGGLQERNGEHGSAHFLEHAMHQGTTTVGVKDPALDRKLLREIHDTEQELVAERNLQRNQLRERNVFFDEGEWPASEKEQRLRKKLYALEDEQSKNRVFWEEYNWYRRNGGIMRHNDPVPANTGNELLRIEVDLPKERLEMFFRLEADRMVNAVFRGWEAQRYTVLEQFFTINRVETGRFSEALNGVTGLAHPIFIHPGGHLRDHNYWNRASMLEMYDEYIVPNNATLALVGDMTIADVRPIAEKYFGRVPRAPEPPAQMDVEVEPPPGGAVRLDWLEPLDPSVTVRYRIPGVGHPDRPIVDVLARLLRDADGLQANASQNGSPSMLSIQTRAARDEDLPALETATLAAVERLRNEPVDEKRLTRIRQEYRFDWEVLRSERGSLASQIGSFAILDSWRTMQRYLEARTAATPRDIQRVARRYLVPWNQVIATTRRNPQPRAEANTASAPPAVPWVDSADTIVPKPSQPSTAAADLLPGRSRPLLNHSWAQPRDLKFAANSFRPPDPQAALVVTPAGLRAYVVPEPGDSLVQIMAALPLGRGFEESNEAGAADLISRFLSRQVSDRLGATDVGRVQVEQDMDLTRVTLVMLPDKWREGISAVIGALRQVALEPASLDVRPSTSSGRGGPGRAGGGGRGGGRGGGGAGRANSELARLVGLAPPDPGPPVRPEAVRSLASRSLNPKAVVLGIGGRVSRAEIVGALRQLTAGWQAPATTASAKSPSFAEPRAATERFRTIDEPGFTTWIAVGHGMPRIPPASEAAVAVMTDVLSMRLNIAIREIRGLASQALMQMTANTRQGGLLHVQTRGRPESVAPLVHYSLEELMRIRSTAGLLTTGELEDVKGGLVLGKWQGSIDGARNASATYAAETVRYGSLDRLLGWPAAVRAVTAEQVRAAAETYIQPDRLVAVLIGQLDAARAARHPRWPFTLDEVAQALRRGSTP